MPRSIEIYMNERGEKPMTFGQSLELPENESDAVQLLETGVKMLNMLHRKVGGQVVVVEDGLIIAIESLTTGKLLWCN